MAADKLHDSGIVLMMSGIGTFETSSQDLSMSAYRGGPEVAVVRSNPRE
jgi:hypothetical protein